MKCRRRPSQRSRRPNRGDRQPSPPHLHFHVRQAPREIGQRESAVVKFRKGHRTPSPPLEILHQLRSCLQISFVGFGGEEFPFFGIRYGGSEKPNAQSDLEIDRCRRRPDLLPVVRRVLSMAATPEARPETMEELLQECKCLAHGDGVEVERFGRA